LCAYIIDWSLDIDGQKLIDIIFSKNINLVRSLLVVLKTTKHLNKRQTYITLKRCIKRLKNVWPRYGPYIWKHKLEENESYRFEKPVIIFRRLKPCASQLKFSTFYACKYACVIAWSWILIERNLSMLYFSKNKNSGR
jgi:hypothetical protein